MTRLSSAVRVERSRDTPRTVSRLRSKRTGLVLGLLILSAPLRADSNLPPARWANEQLPNPEQEAAATALMQELRCLVCQGQSIADSDAELAGDMRALVRERIARGETPDAVRRWLVERYGAWVSYRPAVDSLSWPLWAAPILLLLAGAWLLRGRFRRRT